jgi:hypothetical protein
MNNIDDGIEIWGGTVNLKYLSIWNIGDDSFDVDQGWRGKAQFGLHRPGLQQDVRRQGGGGGDNSFETDGAEDSYGNRSRPRRSTTARSSAIRHPGTSATAPTTRPRGATTRAFSTATAFSWTSASAS